MVSRIFKQLPPGVPIADLPGELPPDILSPNLDLSFINDTARQAFRDPDTHLADGVLWTDLLALTGFIKTQHGSEQVSRSWRKQTTQHQARDFKITVPAKVTRLAKGSSWVTIGIYFRISDARLVGECSGTMAFVPDANGSWRVWMISTILENYLEHGHPDIPRAPPAIPKGDRANATSLSHIDYTAVIIGAGQAGLSLGGRLQALGISYIILEKAATISSSWTSRYNSVRQHTIRHFNNLPFGPTWDDSEEEFLPGKAVSAGHARWASKHQINIRTNTEVTSARHNPDSDGFWLVTYIETSPDAASNIPTTLTSQHILFTLGAGTSMPSRPAIFPGEHLSHTTIQHMHAFKSGAAYTDQNVVVVGTGTAAHDIAQDLLEHRAKSITMLQRNATPLYPMEWYARTQRPSYAPRPTSPKKRSDTSSRTTGSNTNTTTTTTQTPLPQDAISDRLTLGLPTKLTATAQHLSWQTYLASHQSYFRSATRSGFRVLTSHSPAEDVLNRFGRYYIDVGTTAHIISGAIAVRSPVEIERFVEGSKDVLLTNGERLRGVDAVLFATGWETDYRVGLVGMLGEQVAGSLGPFWGLDSRGDLRGLLDDQNADGDGVENAKGSKRPKDLWLFGGAAVHARFFSRFIALKIFREEFARGRMRTEVALEREKPARL